jgi:hypothetical protein
MLQAVCQTGNTTDCANWTYAGQSVELELLGDNFFDAYQIHLDTTGNPTSLGVFRAWVGPLELDRIRISNVPRRGRSALLGRFSGALLPGNYRLEIENPAGQRLDPNDRDVMFDVLEPMVSEAKLDEVAPVVGKQVNLHVSLTNLSSSDLMEVTMELRQQGEGSFGLPAMPDRFTLSAESTNTFDLGLQADTVGDVQLTLSFSAATGAGVFVGAGMGSQIQASIQ